VPSQAFASKQGEIKEREGEGKVDFGEVSAHAVIRQLFIILCTV
jgi:hypothetical protein